MALFEESASWIRDQPPLLALLILLGAAVLARLVDIVLCRVLKRAARRTKSQLDDRLIDLLLIAVLRAWFTRPEAEAPAWYRSQGDPIVGRALQIMQGNPAHPWTVAALAAEIGVSRAALSRRFHDLVGEPPMTFLTGWRLALAADLLCEPDATVCTVAEKVGYSSPFALSTAFKRVRGVSPQEHRARAMSSI